MSQRQTLLKVDETGNAELGDNDCDSLPEGAEVEGKHLLSREGGVLATAVRKGLKA